MNFRAAPSRGGWIGLGFLAAGLLVLAGIVSLMRSGGLGPRTAVLGVLAAALLPFLLLIAYWTWGFFSLSYEIGRDGLVLRWAASRQVIPMQEITRLMAGRAYATPLRGLHWPGHWVGRSQVEDVEGSLRETLAYATQPPEDQLLVMTHSLAYAISPADPEAFVADFKRRRSLGPAQQLVQHTLRPAWARLGIWSDPLALRALAVALTLSVLAFAWIAWQYPSLPERVVVQYRYDPALGATVQGPSQPLATVWLLPLIGLAALIVDMVLAAAVHARARLGANLLLIGASIMQILLLVVLTRLI